MNDNSIGWSTKTGGRWSDDPFYPIGGLYESLKNYIMTFKRGRDPKETMDLGLLMKKRNALKRMIINHIRLCNMDILLRPGDERLISSVNTHLEQEKEWYNLDGIKFSEPEMEQILKDYDGSHCVHKPTNISPQKVN